MACVVCLSSSKSFLAVGGISWRTLVYETPIQNSDFNFKKYAGLCCVAIIIPEVFDESAAWSEAANTEREEHPASGVRRFGRILRQLLADLTVDLVPVEQEYGSMGIGTLG